MKIFLAVLSLSVGFLSHAQIEPPLASPPSIVQQRIGLTDISVDYSRPSMRGRKVMGNLVPYGRIWRVGANESTKINFSHDVKVEGHPIPKDIYALYAFPYPEVWTIVIHKNTSHWGDGRSNYNEKDDMVRFEIKPETSAHTQETFLIEFDELTHNSARMVWLWENTRISFLIEVDTDRQMMDQIDKAIGSTPTADTYYQSARYLQEQSKRQTTALEWLEKAQALVGDKYYIHRVWALVLSQIQDYELAIVHAEKSKQLAALESKDEFVRMNEASIKEWRALLKN